MKRLIKTVMGALISVAMPFGIAGTVLAEDNSPESAAQVCSDETLHDSYVFSAQGFNIVNGAKQPKAVQQVTDFNGDGTFSVRSVTVSINGSIMHFPPGGTGVYTVHANCEGTIAVNNGPSFNIFVRPSGKDIWMIETDPNTVLQGTALRVPRTP